jgi:hypothetical protein
LLELVTVSFGIMVTWDSTGAMWIAVTVSYVVLSAEQLSLEPAGLRSAQHQSWLAGGALGGDSAPRGGSASLAPSSRQPLFRVLHVHAYVQTVLLVVAVEVFFARRGGRGLLLTTAVEIFYLRWSITRLWRGSRGRRGAGPQGSMRLVECVGVAGVLRALLVDL